MDIMSQNNRSKSHILYIGLVSILAIFKEQHKYRSGHHFYNLGSVIELDQEKLKETLKTFLELQLENMIAPQNAQLTWNEKS